MLSSTPLWETYIKGATVISEVYSPTAAQSEDRGFEEIAERFSLCENIFFRWGRGPQRSIVEPKKNRKLKWVIVDIYDEQQAKKVETVLVETSLFIYAKDCVVECMLKEWLTFKLFITYHSEK